ncbi:MAG: glycosyl hydrolase family 32 [Microbacterium sp.]|uniref:glycosyl hydrolase family 32 n=1 Tax=Microbacterium sp. TaxID=51671 RepID=UPI001AC9F10C|nr:glycosyl hydrolase family 32 [Microbacterium sp.]MBN9178846.1 glycosyl hydrolase family 32 [Microbacterium sp.]
MTFEIDDRWVWDFWLARDEGDFHLFFLNAPRALGDPHLRHRNATIGHAVSTDLRTWSEPETVISPGAEEAFDGTATWTGSVIRDGSGWRMFYTGSRFLSEDSHANIESIGEATSIDLHRWSKAPGPLVTPDMRWYETLETGTWPEEAWRDPWVFRADDGWHMLITARARRPIGDDPRDTGVVGHAFSRDLRSWEVRPPLSAPGAGFAHIEVIQPFRLGSRDFILFCCDAAHLVGARVGQSGGIWVAPRDSQSGWCDVHMARRLTDETLYAGRIVTTPDERLALMAFENVLGDDFVGRISDPMYLVADHEGWPVLATDAGASSAPATRVEGASR